MIEYLTERNTLAAMWVKSNAEIMKRVDSLASLVKTLITKIEILEKQNQEILEKTSKSQNSTTS